MKLRPRALRLAIATAAVVLTLRAAWPGAGIQAQTAARPVTGLLMGVVIDPLTKRPVAGAQVTIGGTVTGLPNTQVLTDAEGQFVFLDVPKGVYTITAAKAGYADGALGRRRPEGPGQSVTLGEAERIGDLSVPIWKFGAITGTVRDEAGEPMVALPVRVLRRTVVAGRRKLAPGATVRTDDRGLYRFGSLVPGDYVVAVPSTQSVAPESIVDLYRARLTGGPSQESTDLVRDLSFSGGHELPNWISRNGASSVGDLAYVSLSGDMRAGTAPPAGGRLFVYPTQFHPAAMSATQATTITVRPGEERLGVDLQMKLVPAVRITGTVTGPSGPLITVMTLIPETDDYATEASLETAMTLSNASGRFTFIGVPPGQYRLRAIRAEVPPAGPGGRAGGPARTPTASPAPTPAPLLGGYTLSATETLSVGASDIDGLAINVRYGFRVSGRVEFPNPSSPVEPDAIRRISILLDPADGRPLVNSTIGRAPVNERGEFTSYQVPPGRYYLRVNNAPSGWTLKRAMSAGRDVSNVPLRLESDAGGITIEFTQRPSTLSGQVRDAAGAPDPTATVLIFPAGSEAWTDYGDFPRRLRAVRADKDGRYEAVALPAGDYLVVAVLDESTMNWQDPVTLKALARLATTVTLADNEVRSLTLKTVAVSR